MKRIIQLDIDEHLNRMTRDGMKKFVKELLSASDEQEKKILSSAKNDLADLDEEMHGKPNTPRVEDDDLSDDDDELPPVPKKRKS
jgi:hypothetical protein